MSHDEVEKHQNELEKELAQEFEACKLINRKLGKITWNSTQNLLIGASQQIALGKPDDEENDRLDTDEDLENVIEDEEEPAQ